MLISAVTGMGGIGKTALALEAAHRACRKGWFPGGALFVDLRGYDDDPVTADQAVLALLDALGVRGPDLPATATGQYDAYRALLGERRERTLLILDNVSDPRQFLPLLPGTDHHRVLVTSRERPDALPVRRIDLDPLAADDAVALVARALLDADERDDRPAREPEALRELAGLCGHLPLALQIAAAMLRRRHPRAIASLVRDIHEAADRTVVLDGGPGGTDQYGRSLILRPVLETSYRRLPSGQARLLRLLALAPGTETHTSTVAALAGLDWATALSQLEELAATGLVTRVRGADGNAVPRWLVHDLVRAYAAGTVAADPDLREEGEAARERVLRFYAMCASLAYARLRWLPGEPEPELFPDRASALSWLDRERAALVAAVQWAAEDRYAYLSVPLAEFLSEYLEWRRYFDDWLTVAGAARDAAHRTGDRRGESVGWDHLGLALRNLGRTEQAIDAHLRALELSRADGDRDGEAVRWGHLANALARAGRPQEAIEAHLRARALHQAGGHVREEADEWNNLALSLHALGRTEEAVDAHVRARDLYLAIGDRHGAGIAWNNLARTWEVSGRTAEAVEAYGNALELEREFGDWFGAGRTLNNLARVHAATGDPARARAALLQAADAYTRAGAPAEAALCQSGADALT
ncbi:AfsR-like transcriptional regulator TcrA [Streptomyces bangladeshensis]|uniref:AfsR-like transcriptional regulator TcrA n=2 Tax=Streptomyces bangladeshensis TaxID=295352 RepID=A0ABN3C815_9ACTN